MKTWTPPDQWLRITSFDAHAAGEPLRIITEGFPSLPGKTILEKRRYAREHWDHLRKALMWEPRGHADMYGCILTEPVTEDGTLGVLFMHNEGFSTMCGHAIIALTCVLPEAEIIELSEDSPEIRFDTPAGRVTASAQRISGRVVNATFRNVPSFVYALDQTVTIPGLGPVRYDVAYGGAFYAFCRAEEMDLKLRPEEFGRLIDLGMRIKHAVQDALTIRHPVEPDLGFLYGTIFYGPPEDADHFSRNVCIFAEGEVDRSPTGTGVSARAALHYSRGEIGLRESFVVESILGTSFTGRVIDVCRFGPYPAVVPEISGRGFITGRSEFFLDPEDPLAHGFIFR